jgi:hypothetical protein
MNHQAAHNQPTNTTALRRGVQRYGFNGMDVVSEFVSAKSTYDFGDRALETRIGRWMSLDPKFTWYAGSTPFGFALCNPINNIDIAGNYIMPITTKSLDDLVSHWNSVFSKNGEESPMTQVFMKFLRHFKYDSYVASFSPLNLLANRTSLKEVRKDYRKAMRGLSSDQKALARGYWKLITSKKQVRFLSYSKGDDIERVFKNAELESKYGADIEKTIADHGGGFSVTETVGGQSGELVAVDLETVGKTPLTMGLPEAAQTGTGSSDEAIAHEMVGHSLAKIEGLSQEANHISAIQVSNLVRRIKGEMSSRNGQDHQAAPAMINQDLNATPSYLSK